MPRKSGKGRRGSSLVEAEAVSDHGRLPRPATPSSARILETWMLAVFGVMNSAWRICRSVRPAATLPRPWPTTRKPKRCASVERQEMSVSAQAECQCGVLWLPATDRESHAAAHRCQTSGPTCRQPPPRRADGAPRDLGRYGRPPTTRRFHPTRSRRRHPSVGLQDDPASGLLTRPGIGPGGSGPGSLPGGRWPGTHGASVFDLARRWPGAGHMVCAWIRHRRSWPCGSSGPRAGARLCPAA
jgi:hypothetical protein